MVLLTQFCIDLIPPDCAMDSEDLSHLLQSAEQLAPTYDDIGHGELPRVDRNLRQIMDASQQLWLKASQGGGPEKQGET